MKVAVIGGGVSGLASSYLLAPHASVTLYESERRLGGHAHTVDVTYPDGEKEQVDTGFMVCNPDQYPYFMSLLEELEVDTVDTVMSFSVHIPGEVEYSSFLSGLLGNIRQLCKPRYIQLLYSIIRFNRVAKRALHQGSLSGKTLQQFLTEHQFPKVLAQWYLYPMLGSIWSAPISDIDDFPAEETIRFLYNHRLLNIIDKPTWKTIKGGSRVYVERLQKKLEEEGVICKTGACVTQVSSEEDGTITVISNGKTEVYDVVIMATHADTAMMLLGNATLEQQQALEGFSYSENKTVLHSYEGMLPKSKKLWSSWNYHAQQDKGVGESLAISLTYNMNTLQHIEPHHPLYVTLNTSLAIPDENIHGTYTYRHPVFNRAANESQKRVTTIQGLGGVYFAGAHLGWGFHEDGVVSAVKVLESMSLPVRLQPKT